jgi:sugar lactone lactonase YvrE
MAIRRDPDGRPQITAVTPAAAIPGGEVTIRGKGLARPERPRVTIGEVAAPVVVGSDTYVVVRVPEGAVSGELVVGNNDRAAVANCDIGVQIADSLNPVANPAVDSEGNIYTTLSGPRGQKTPVAVYRIDANYNVRPFVTDLMNATGIAIDSEDRVYVSSRYDGMVYEASPTGSLSVHVEGMGLATGLAFDREENLYVGDRQGTIFKISRSRQIFVFATLEPSVSAYHLAFGPADDLYVSGPTTSSYDTIYRITPAGDVQVFYRGLGRPQGLAFDNAGNLYAAASLGGRRGIVRIDAEGNATQFLSGPAVVGLAFTRAKELLVATTNALYRVDAGIKGRPLL